MAQPVEPTANETVMTPESFRLDQRNHAERPFLDQLAGLGWEILDLDNR